MAGNEKLVREGIARAESAGAHIVVFPELTITGYPPEDLLLYPPFIEENQRRLKAIAASVRRTVAIVGYAELATTPQRSVPGPSAASAGIPGGTLFNAAAVLAGGEVVCTYRKVYLPNYGVFDEKRYFAAGTECPVVSLDGVLIGVNICEDIWFPLGPAEVQAAAGAEVIVTLNGSPFEAGKEQTRASLVKGVAARGKAYSVFVNMVGGQDELVFDGGSMVAGPDGQLISRAPLFAEAFTVVDLNVARVRQMREGALPQPAASPQLAEVGAAQRYSIPPLPAAGRLPPLPPASVASMDKTESVYRALVLGTRDYLRKSGFGHVLIGMSGGVDSTLVAVIAADAIGARNVTGVAMPSRFSSEGSLLDAQEVARSLGMDLWTVPIEPAHTAFEEMLAPPYAGTRPNVAEENVQSRIRGNVLMSLSNKFGWLVLTTGNKSEMATGYATLYGDMAGGYAVIKDVPKVLVYELCRWRNAAGPGSPIPQTVMDKAPTAELKFNQTDQDTLPPYRVLDRIIEMYIERRRPIAEIIAAEAGMTGEHADAATVLNVVRMIDRNEYKRRQAPPGVKITGLAFGRDRRLPLASRYRPET
jgi:NAD+ synthase (glutamine-hydrolysing)